MLLPFCPAAIAMKNIDPSPEHAFIECAKCHLKQKQTASKAHWFAQVLFQDTTDDRRDLTLFKDAITKRLSLLAILTK